VQNRTGYAWTLEEVRSRLEEIMSRQFAAVYDFMEAKGIDMRTAAYSIALSRLGEAIAAQGTRRYFTSKEP
jgi:glutamate dehydrogenase (NADP+)